MVWKEELWKKCPKQEIIGSLWHPHYWYADNSVPAALIKADKSRSEYKSECCNNSVSIRISDCFNSQWQGKPGQRLLSSRWGSFSLTAYQRSKLTALSNLRKRGRRSGEGLWGPGGASLCPCYRFGLIRSWRSEKKEGGGEKRKVIWQVRLQSLLKDAISTTLSGKYEYLCHMLFSQSAS